ncbi:MAG: succinate dehydrogenase iron-sulfur subunit, partial [Candidatus Acidiferrales bacterium]
MPDKTFIVRIKRQQRPDESVRWEEFELRYRPYMNVITCLRDITEKPYTRNGSESTPVTYDANCLEEICGACAMLINGNPRQACSALVDDLEKPIRLEPLAKFPLIRDLQVDRSSMFENLKRTKCWIPIDGTYDLGPGPRMAPEKQEIGYPLSRCITCGNCLEICPKVNENSHFVGAAIVSQVRL